MFVFIWATLLFSGRGSNADTGASAGEKTICPITDYCITIPEGEVTAEAGLCVFIPCSFTTGYGFTPQHIVWYKCEPSKQRCADSDIIFHTNRYNRKVQAGYKGRVSLLESDLSERNCSIIINDLTESDSGEYQLIVNGLKFGRSDGFHVLSKVTVSVKDLSQKPTVMIPPLAEGQQTTLTCTAPGLCSGSVPTITWTWRGRGEKNTQITGNIMTETLTAVTQRHRSALTFNPSAEHHGTDVTCKVSFTGGTTTEETVTLNVNLYPKIFNHSGCEKSSQLNVVTCVCSSRGFPLPTIKWPLLETHTEYSVITTGSNYTVNSTITLTAKDHSNSVQCVSSNDIGEAKMNLTIKTASQEGILQPNGFVAVLVLAIVSLIGNVFYTIVVIFLWNTRKKVKSNEANDTYMSLNKRDQSAEYDVIAQRLN